MATVPPLGPGLTQRRLRVADADVVLLRAILEAYDGLALIFGSGDGTVSVITTGAQQAALDALLGELRDELAVVPLPAAEPGA
ncbi:MAG: DUF4911 domain-containing protein [Myxococcales bacterium]|nr:DUF4911 domain-containing protein [Myxococcales bacterium]